jgi:ABC-type polysaccharide/polyol phosphate transport system ATPase subunit
MAKIILKNIFLDFPIYNGALSLRSKLVNLGTGGRLMSNAAHIPIVRALEDVSLEINKGDKVGIIGHNGAGKTTLLKLITGIYHPSAGTIHTEGKINAFFSVMNGMDQESTGYDNIYLMGTLLGMKRSEIKRLIPEIVEFTGLGSYLEVPVRTYSDGMKLRLGFAVYTSIYPEVLLLDESIGAGDASFLDKAKKRVESFYKKAEILVISSHSFAILEQFCNKVLWMEKGQIKKFGSTKQVLNAYQESLKSPE